MNSKRYLQQNVNMMTTCSFKRIICRLFLLLSLLILLSSSVSVSSTTTSSTITKNTFKSIIRIVDHNKNNIDYIALNNNDNNNLYRIRGGGNNHNLNVKHNHDNKSSANSKRIVSTTTNTNIVIPQPSISIIVLSGIIFINVFIAALVSFVPVTGLMNTQLLNYSTITSLLAYIRSFTAFLEIIITPYIGKYYLINIKQQKYSLLYNSIIMVLMNTAVTTLYTSNHYSLKKYTYMNIILICAARLISMLSMGLFFVTMSSMISNIFTKLESSSNSEPESTTIIPSSSSSTSVPHIELESNDDDNNNNSNDMRETVKKQNNINKNKKHQLGQAIGIQNALIRGGLMLGSLCAGYYSKKTTITSSTISAAVIDDSSTILQRIVNDDDNVRIPYGIASIVGCISIALTHWGIQIPTNHDYKTTTLISTKTSTTIPTDDGAIMKNKGHHSSSIQQQKKNNNNNIISILQKSLLSCTALLTKYGIKVRILSIILLLQMIPTFSGDYFQIYVKEHWKLDTKEYSTFIALYAVTGICSDIVSSLLIPYIGIKYYTIISTLSGLLIHYGSVLYGYNGAIYGLIFGFLGSSQTIGIMTSLIQEGTKSGVPHGTLAGERSSLLAICKVICPLLYSTLYINGQKLLGITTIPFIFNILIGIIAFILIHIYL